MYGQKDTFSGKANVVSGRVVMWLGETRECTSRIPEGRGGSQRGLFQPTSEAGRASPKAAPAGKERVLHRRRYDSRVSERGSELVLVNKNGTGHS